MATPLLPTSPAKRLRSVSFEENIQTHTILDFDIYNSDEDSDFYEMEYVSTQIIVLLILIPKLVMEKVLQLRWIFLSEMTPIF